MNDDLTRVSSYLLPAGYFLEEFEILSVLGEGGFGAVYLARDHKLGQLRAVKEFHPGQFSVRNNDYTIQPKNSYQCSEAYQKCLESFINEAKLLASVDHPNIIRIYRCIESNNTAYIIMHYYEGETLESWLSKQKGLPLSPYWAQHLLWQLLNGLQVVHSKGILHRDIKPSNIYLADGYRPVLIDFGAARRVVGEMTNSLTSIVTTGFSPIEQYTEFDNHDIRQGPWTDIYALGATMYRVIKGKKPADSLKRVMNDSIDPINTVTSYPFNFIESIDKALSVKPNDRFQSVDEWLNELGQMPDISKSTLIKNTKSKGKKKRWFIAVTCIFALTVLTYLIYSKLLVSYESPLNVEKTENQKLKEEIENLKQKIVTQKNLSNSDNNPSENIMTFIKKNYVDGEVFRDCEDCPEMVVIPKGEFIMGSPLSESDRQVDEGPVHHVVLSQAFALSKFEITLAEWKRFVAATAYNKESCDEWQDGRWKRNQQLSWHKPGFEQHENEPVVCITWEDANRYVGWLKSRTQVNYRLPSEAEWEYAARGGNIGKSFWEDKKKNLCLYANTNDRDCDDRHTKTSPVGGFHPNKFGLYDMLGNVWEWTDDCWHSHYAGAPQNGSAWLADGDCGLRVLRGGSWMDDNNINRFANRDKEDISTGGVIHGFRIARDLN